MQQYSDFYGPHLVLQLNRTPADFPTYLIRLDAMHLGDGRPLVAGPSNDFPTGGWQTLQVGRSDLAAIESSADIALFAKGGASISFVPYSIGIAAFSACINALPPGSNEAPADAPSNGWRFVPLQPNRAPSHGTMPRLDYPQTALQEDREGDTVVQIVVQPDGTSTGCTIVSSSGSPDLDHAACAGTIRMRFRVATDGNGVPIAATVRVPFAWRIAG
jgi:protein TonB